MRKVETGVQVGRGGKAMGNAKPEGVAGSEMTGELVHGRETKQARKCEN